MTPAPNVAFFVSILALAYTKDLNNTGEYKLLTIIYISEWRLTQWSSFAPFTISKRLAQRDDICWPQSDFEGFSLNYQTGVLNDYVHSSELPVNVSGIH